MQGIQKSLKLPLYHMHAHTLMGEAFMHHESYIKLSFQQLFTKAIQFHPCSL